MQRAGRDVGILRAIAEFVVAIGGALALLIAAILFAVYHGPVPSWSLLVAGAVAVAVSVLAYFIARRPSADDTALQAARADAERAVTEVTVATSYLSNTDDFLTGMRQALQEVFANASDPGAPARALRQLERVRQLAFDAVIQGINSSRAEHIRCVFFKPTEEADGVMLVPEHHHGHTTDVQKLRLHADGRSVAGTAFATRQSVYIARGASDDPRVQKVPEGKPMETLLCIPAFGPHVPDPVGVFSVDSNRPDAFTLSDREFASVCASIFALVDFFTAVFENPPEFLDEGEEPPELEGG